MSPCFAIVDLSREEPQWILLRRENFSIGFRIDCDFVLPLCDDLEDCSSAKLIFADDPDSKKRKVLLERKCLDEHAVLFVNSIYQTKSTCLKGVELEDGDCVELMMKNKFILRGVFSASSAAVLNQSPLAVAPDDVLRPLVARMDRDEVIAKFSIICKRLFQFIRTGLPWNTLALPLPKTPLTSEWNSFCAAVSSGVHRLTINIEDQSHADIAEQLRIHKWTRLEHLEIDYSRASTEVREETRGNVKGIMLDAFRLRMIDSNLLVSLCVEGIRFSMRDLEGLRLPQLKCLRIGSLQPASNQKELVHDFFRGIESLEELRVDLLEHGSVSSKDLVFLQRMPDRWTLRKLGVRLGTGWSDDFASAGDKGYFRNLIELDLASDVSFRFISLPEVQKLRLTEFDLECWPWLTPATDVTIHASYDNVGFNYDPAKWDGELLAQMSDERVKSITSLDLYPAVDVPFHRFSSVEFLKILKCGPWQQDRQELLRCLKLLPGLRKIRGFFFDNSKLSKLRILGFVEWELEYLALSSPVDADVLRMIVGKFPGLKLLQIPYCGSGFWDSVSKLKNLVCLVVGDKNPGGFMPHLPLATGFDEFMANKPPTLRFVEFNGYVLYCPDGQMDYKHYLGEDGKQVVRVREDPVPRDYCF